MFDRPTLAWAILLVLCPYADLKAIDIFAPRDSPLFWERLIIFYFLGLALVSLFAKELLSIEPETPTIIKLIGILMLPIPFVFISDVVFLALTYYLEFR
jgi:hypothetical protein